MMKQAEQRRTERLDRAALIVCSVLLVAWLVVGIWRA